jgi:hypothetical protein
MMIDRRACKFAALAAGLVLWTAPAWPQSSIGGPQKQGVLGGPAPQKSLVMPTLPANQTPVPQPVKARRPHAG